MYAYVISIFKLTFSPHTNICLMLLILAYFCWFHSEILKFCWFHISCYFIAVLFEVLRLAFAIRRTYSQIFLSLRISYAPHKRIPWECVKHLWSYIYVVQRNWLLRNSNMLWSCLEKLRRQNSTFSFATNSAEATLIPTFKDIKSPGWYISINTCCCECDILFG